ncbi:helix-turn-helix domain protein [Clostridium tepidiprofundi DSM 19306]|uniref:Helix-turn-helix domain protein n=1 Tax=Clostridium tepidiprofundi DSM 19306 TaxID=1121338 RepID=A0A151B501_9CLOT|nr:helix-turn-helix transcriptional regulator [Clostridium tepidiprofundi]KYH34737.1 helix-turn-helix domain protein [Clostridium tepidiprofundi DSM 19306]
MEILSTGEKIKRARVFKGYTLKQLCGDKVSVSKMSCIENNKIQPEDWIIRFVCEKLDLDYDYLNESIEEQLNNNLKYLKDNKDIPEYKEEISKNLDYCEKYELFDMAIEFMHILFDYCLDKDKVEIQSLCIKYYDLYQKAYSEKNRLVFYIDMAAYFYENNEYQQAINYYKDIEKSLYDKPNKSDKEYQILIVALYNSAASYVMTKNHKKAYNTAMKIEEFIEFVNKDWKKADIYHMLAMLSLRLDNTKFDFYEKKSYEYYKDNDKLKAQAIYNYAVVMLDIGLLDRGVSYIKKCLEYFPKDDIICFVDYMLMSVEELLERDFIDEAREICDNALNYSIKMDNIKHIEKAYYFKAIVSYKKGEFSIAEMYINLALDALLKFGTKEEIYKRYIYMGNMYYKLNNIADSLKYFDLAVRLQKKM